MRQGRLLIAIGVLALLVFSATVGIAKDRNRGKVHGWFGTARQGFCKKHPDRCPPTTTTTTPSTTTNPPPTTTVPPPPPGNLRAVDGGSDYYSHFSNPLPIADTFFPIGVWGAYAQDPTNLNKDAAVGINTYVWAADHNYLPAIRADGRFHVIEDGTANTGSETNGWMLGDELDMTADPGPISCPSALDQGFPNDGRLRMMNFGKGLALPPGDGPDFPAGTHNWWADTAEQRCWENGLDLTSNDFYWFTDPNDGPANRYAYLYGNNITNARNADASDGQMHPHWAFVEVGWPFTESASQGGRAILPAEIRAATWHSIIAGARGIIYFQHSFGGPCITHHALREDGTSCYGAVVTAVTTLDGQIKSLAPVLNSPFEDSFASASSSVRLMTKNYNGQRYIFAGSMGGASTATFNVQGGSTATVLFENRTIPITSGQFSDSFSDGNAIHIYRID